MASNPLVFTASTRPFPGETANGDAWAAHWHGSTCRVVLVDGLGHGPEAEVAAKTALEALAAQPDAGPEQSIHLLHEALVGTRGAVGLLVFLDLAASSLTYVSVGNVEGRLCQSGAEHRFMAFRGVLGLNLPSLRVVRLDLAPEWTLILHSDGVSARFALAEVSACGAGDPQALADEILAQWGRLTDDATVLIVQPAKAARSAG